jgi:hypothetical protein
MSAINEIRKATETARVLLEAGADETKVLAAFYRRVDQLVNGENPTANRQESPE